MNTKKGSILAYSLVVISIMLAIASSLSAVSIIEKKSASSTEASMQALQTADSGLQLAIQALNNAGSADRLDDIFAPIVCDNADKTFTFNATGDPAGASYTLTFLNALDNPVNCNTKNGEFSTIKSVGTYQNTFRTASIGIVRPAFSWIASATCGISVYGSDVDGAGKKWESPPLALCVAPQCDASNSLVPANDDIMGVPIDFSDYPARAACQEKGGRLPTLVELQCMQGEILTNGSVYVTSFRSGVGNEYWSALDLSNVTPGNAQAFSLLPLATVFPVSVSKNANRNVRCVK